MTDRPGAVPSQLIAEMIGAGYIAGASAQAIQPSSLDLTLTDVCYRMRGSYLPRQGEQIREIVSRGALYQHPLDRPLETDAIYLVKLSESLQLPPGIHATANSKSSSGRINLRTRLLADGVPRFDSIPAGFHGGLWIELIPKSFPIRLHPGDRLNQMRFFHGEARLSSLEHRMMYDRYRLLRATGSRMIPTADEAVSDGITMTIDLPADDIAGWRAHPSAWSVLDTADFDHDPRDFFEPIQPTRNGELILNHGSFYILATKEKVIIPPAFAAEMAPYDPTKGEFRSHFAGFFDPGFGWNENDAERGWQAVLEVATHGHDFIIRDGQPICLMVYERLLAKPHALYGQDLKSNYIVQKGPRLAKWFKTA